MKTLIGIIALAVFLSACEWSDDLRGSPSRPAVQKANTQISTTIRMEGVCKGYVDRNSQWCIDLLALVKSCRKEFGPPYEDKFQQVSLGKCYAESDQYKEAYVWVKRKEDQKRQLERAKAERDRKEQNSSVQLASSSQKAQDARNYRRLLAWCMGVLQDTMTLGAAAPEKLKKHAHECIRVNNTLDTCQATSRSTAAQARAYRCISSRTSLWHFAWNG